jgi:hypothetical protein
MENSKQKARIEILDEWSKKYGKDLEIENFKDFINTYDYDAIVLLVRKAMGEYWLQGTKDTFSKHQVISLIRKFNEEVTIGGKSELKDKYIGSLTYPELQQKWIDENI